LAMSKVTNAILTAHVGRDGHADDEIESFVFTLVFIGVCSGQYYDRVAYLKDAPFSAEVQGSFTTRDHSNAWTVEIARASDGSVYEATIDPVGEFKGSIRRIKIEDATSDHTGSCRRGQC